MHDIDETANGQTISIRRGDAFDLELNEPRTSGFRWNIEEAGKTVGHLQELKTPSEASRLGTPAPRRWEFTAERVGSSFLRLRLQRSWEPPGFGRVFELMINVTD